MDTMQDEVTMWREEAKKVIAEDGKCSAGAKHLLEMALEAGDGESAHILSMIECEGNLNEYPVEEPKFANGVAWLKQQADNGDSVSQYQYGRILIFAGGAADMRGLDYLIASSDNGYAFAAYELGDLYASDMEWGDSFQPDQNEALKWYEKAVGLGCIEAADRMSELLNQLVLKAQSRHDEEMANELLDKLCKYTKIAAEGGFPSSQMRMAELCVEGRFHGNEKSEADARYWLACAEKGGSVIAHECVELILNEGKTATAAIESCRTRL